MAATVGRPLGDSPPAPQIHKPEHRHFLRDAPGGVIFCEATPLAGVGDDPAELSLYARGYRWCICFTPACPQGEGGHIHISQLTEISSAAFDQARRSGWAALEWK